MSLNDTPNANRLHIAIYGKRNSGKSTFLNMMCNQDVSMVSSIAGTTTDPVIKAMELHGLGPVVFYDTAGFDDEGELGRLRVDKTKKVIEKTDIAILLFHDLDITKEKQWLNLLKKQHIPVLCIYNLIGEKKQSDIVKINSLINEDLLIADLNDIKSRELVRERLLRLLPADYQNDSIVGHLVKDNDIVLLVMPQDIQAPKGRLILPQVQTIRDLLDRRCVVQSCTADQIDQALSSLKRAPQLIITDSQVFPIVHAKKPKESQLTSFSILFARYKGDIDYFMESAKVISNLTENSHILIAEACTHAPLSEDIGRVKIPRMLRQRIGEDIKIDMVSGTDFPDDLSQYDLIIHCGACMFSRKYVLNRIEKAKNQGIPMTNYGVTIAYLKSILDDVVY